VDTRGRSTFFWSWLRIFHMLYEHSNLGPCSAEARLIRMQLHLLHVCTAHINCLQSGLGRAIGWLNGDGPCSGSCPDCRAENRGQERSEEGAKGAPSLF
jgi:hypothetical protein